ncbi:MAG: hypothetical protein CUN56_00885 [Phototrophicales bacterium]|nr:MAG: hypothetical protein CUN56_00885 [Phototrophicales bacterium]RMG74436.1 MAG: hypothetical protein D6711_08890 [Chloroflexota bacterium]
MDWQNVLLIGGGICCCGIPILGFIAFRFLGMTMFLPAFGAVWNVLEGMFGGDDGSDDEDSSSLRRQSRPTPTKPRAQSAQMMDFDVLVEKYRQEKQSPSIGAQGADKSQFGVRRSDIPPGRTLRDKRFRRNQVSSEMPETDLDQPPKPDRDFLSRRPTRDTRRREHHDDEIFGGILDDDGDGYIDS